MLLILLKKLELGLMVVSVLLRIKLRSSQISVPEKQYTDVKTAWINPWYV